MECEGEWADNKKLVDLSKKDIRKSVKVHQLAHFFSAVSFVMYVISCTYKL
jgi:hypothetical protein